MAVGTSLRHVIESQQFSRPLLEEIFERADQMRRDPHRAAGRLQGRIMAALFYEPSTRTRLSFESAMLRLGGRTMGTDNAREFSSAAKGETLEDTIRIVSGYADVIVLRHAEEGAARRAAAASEVPVINAGDGPGQHPTQALLDVYTIRDELGRLDGIRVALVGDLANGRTVRSLVYLLGKYRDIEVSCARTSKTTSTSTASAGRRRPTWTRCCPPSTSSTRPASRKSDSRTRPPTNP
jgi:aspartate carbamoyltransferase catalytic subunit